MAYVSSVTGATIPVKFAENLTSRIHKKLTTAFQKMGKEGEADIKASLGTICQAYAGTGGEHSRPGEPPHKETGELQASVGHVVQAEPLEIKLRLYADAPYAAYLEFGTSRMRARPFLRPALHRLLPRARAIIKESS
jgi:HK97 gp10 family phage protein